MNYQSDYEWQKQFDPAVRVILARVFAIDPGEVEFTEPTSDSDRKHNTDAFIRVDGRVYRVSKRTRRYVIGDDFTIRYQRPSSATEWDKIWRNYGDYFFYGHGIEKRLVVERWFVGSMTVFRDWVRSYLDRGEDPPHKILTNTDGSSSLIIFDRYDLPPEFTIAYDEDDELREVWWAIVKDSKGMYATGHGSAVRWARAGLELDEDTFPRVHSPGVDIRENRPRLCPSCRLEHPAGTTCDAGWAPWDPWA